MRDYENKKSCVPRVLIGNLPKFQLSRWVGIIVLLSLFINENADSQICFESPFAIEVGKRPQSISVVDLNGDTFMDIITVNYESNDVSIAIGDGFGGFASVIAYRVGINPQYMTSADFDGDLKIDIAVTNTSSHTVSILFGDGLGGFSMPVDHAVGHYPEVLVTDDFNLDGQLDLAVATNDGVSILLGDGSGDFEEFRNYPAGSTPISLVSGHFNSDSILDLAVTDINTFGRSYYVSVLFGDGAGGFGTADFLQVGNTPYSIVEADFNNDGRSDLATANTGGNDVSVLLGDGNAGFGPAISYPTGNYPQAIIAIDMNSDGHMDLVTANANADNATLLIGDGLGKFSIDGTFSVGNGPTSLAIADFNSDGRTDVVVSNYYSDQATILLSCLNTEVTNFMKDEILIYPNPADSQFMVKLNSGPKILSMRNITGFLMKSQPIEGKTTINISDFPTGVYSVQIGEDIHQACAKLIIIHE